MKRIYGKKFLVPLSMLLLCTLCISVGIYQQTLSLSRLSEEQIENLRDEYPICSLDGPPAYSMRIFTLDEMINLADTFIYGEVESNMDSYSENISTGIPDLDEKRAADGISNQVGFYGYTIRIMGDSEGVCTPGDTIYVSNNADFFDYRPKFEKGMKVVFGVSLDQRGTGYPTVGTYYVTDDGYALSAFPEEQKTMKSRGTYSGVKVEYLLKQLKKK